MNCRNCINWADQSLNQTATDPDNNDHVFMGCKLYGFRANTEIEQCDSYQESKNLYALCNVCGLPVPKVCLSLGECVNCTDTDLFCVDHCTGGDSRKYCTHLVRLRTEGLQLIDNEKHEVFDLFPALDMPGQSEEPEEKP